VGTFEVEGGPDGAQCRPSSAPADLAIGTTQLGSAYLGGVSFTEMYDAGLIDADAETVARADAMFSTRPAPAMTSWF
jgi:predicted acetyltransferase